MLRGITPCIPPRANRRIQHGYDKAAYKKVSVRTPTDGLVIEIERRNDMALGTCPVQDLNKIITRKSIFI